MDDEAAVLLIDAHSKGDGCNYDLNVVGQPAFVYFIALGFAKARMIEIAFKAELVEVL